MTVFTLLRHAESLVDGEKADNADSQRGPAAVESLSIG
jgi:hypothetical protein